MTFAPTCSFSHVVLNGGRERSAVKGCVPVFALVFLAATACAQEVRDTVPRSAPSVSRFTFGGSVGAGFGSVTWVGLSGEVGYLATDRLWTGLSGMFRYTDDSRYQPHFSGVDYGFGVFGRCFVFDRFFASAEPTWTSYESRIAGAGRYDITSFFVGGGYGQPLGGRGNVLFEVLYDVTGNAKEVYGTPWAVRAGFTYGF